MLLKEYILTTILPGGYIFDQLLAEVESSDAINGFTSMTIDSGGGTLKVYGSSITDEQALDDLMQNHVPNMAIVVINKTVIQNKKFADDLMQRIKEKNILEGLSTIDQAAWVHHRMRKISHQLTTTDMVDIDLMNLVVSGDIETAEQVLGQMAPDDMTQPYHWFTQSRIDWIRNQIREYLGWPQL